MFMFIYVVQEQVHAHFHVQAYAHFNIYIYVWVCIYIDKVFIYSTIHVREHIHVLYMFINQLMLIFNSCCITTNKNTDMAAPVQTRIADDATHFVGRFRVCRVD